MTTILPQAGALALLALVVVGCGSDSPTASEFTSHIPPPPASAYPYDMRGGGSFDGLQARTATGGGIGGPLGPGMPTPMRFIPPSEKVREAYRAPDGSTVSIAAVCKVTESDVSCWDGRGQPDPGMTERVRNGIQLQIPSEPGRPLPLYFGSKNRLIIVRIETMERAGPSEVRMSLVGAGKRPAEVGYPNIFLSPDRPRPGGRTVIRYECRSAVEDANAKTTSAYVNLLNPEPMSLQIATQLGSTGTWIDMEFKVESVRALAAGKDGLPNWEVVISATGKGKDIYEIALSPYKNAEEAISFALADGRLLTQKEYLEIVEKETPGKLSKALKLRPVTVVAAAKEGKYRFVVPYDPRLVARFTLQGQPIHAVAIVDIPLDPR
ncbi:MAG: hypothetical protein BGO01_09205 [Armatimonadetes bacterium 55-13]|nr:MAG: hypothetical protein BGO01_09205 [Armatimonadetes bacterium 55-13]